MDININYLNWFHCHAPYVSIIFGIFGKIRVTAMYARKNYTRRRESTYRSTGGVSQSFLEVEIAVRDHNDDHCA